MNFLLRSFGGVQASYLVRSCLIRPQLFALVISVAVSADTKNGSLVGLLAFLR